MSIQIKQELEIKSKVLNSINDSVIFEHDDEINQYCVFFKDLDGYYGQGKTKEIALLELLSSYLDTCNS